MPSRAAYTALAVARSDTGCSTVLIPWVEEPVTVTLHPPADQCVWWAGRSAGRHMDAISQRLDEAGLLADLRDRAFAPSSAPVRVGLELEMLALRGKRAVSIIELLQALEPLLSL